jgi:pimeloyl-ACP methyl ester carboxylesterase
MAIPELQTTTTADGLTLAWREAGAGPALVLLHGIGSGSLGWGAQLEAFADRCRVIAWDAPGYGGSGDLSQAAPTPADYADALAGLLDALGIAAAHLCGNSLGALFIGAFVRRYRDRVLSLVLCDAAPGHARLTDAERAEKLQARVDAVETLGPAGMAEQRAHTLVAPGTGEAVLAAVRAVMSRVRPHGYVQAAHALAQGDLLADLEGCTAPALVLCGAEDVVTPPDGNRAAAAALVNSRFALLDGVGHLPYVEAPDRFNRLVGDFLAGLQEAAA